MRSGNLSALLALALLASAGPSAAQRVLELPVRTSAGADALAGGPIAVFWNPGAARLPDGRGEVLLVDVRGPSATGLDGTALAGALRLDARTTLLLGFMNVRIDEIEQTTTSPLPQDGAAPIDLAENIFAVAAVRALGPSVSVGAGVQYARAAEAVGGDDVTEIGAGFAVRPDHAFRPTIAASARVDDDGTHWTAGVEAAPDAARVADWSFRASYGVHGSPRFHGISHRLGGAAAWQDRVSLSVGIAAEPGQGGHTLDPVLGLAVHFRRYTVGLLREDLPNGIGAVHAFRLGVAF